MTATATKSTASRPIKLFFLCALCVLCGEISFAGENTPRGPRVEITPSDGRPAYTCCLLGFKDGLLDLLLDSGETRQEKAGGAKSIRFLPPAETAAPLPTPKRVEALGRWPGWGPEDGRRLWELDQHEAQGTLTPAEAIELLKLRERAPPPLLKMEATRQKVLLEGGKLDVGVEQRRLRGATQEEEAGEALRRLVLAYLQQGYTGPKLKELLQKDAESIANTEVRKKIVEHIDHLANWAGLHRQWRKDK